MPIWERLCRLFSEDSEQTEELREAFQEDADREYQEFKEAMLREEKETIFHRAYEINFYKLVHEYILKGGSVNRAVLESVDTDKPIWQMYLYCEKEDVCIGDWSDVETVMNTAFSCYGGELQVS